MSTNALIKDWAKGGKEKMCVPACLEPTPMRRCSIA